MSIHLRHAAALNTGLTASRSNNQSSGLVAALRTLSAWMERSQQRRALGELAQDEHMLADIGLTWEQALGEAAKPFWTT